MKIWKNFTETQVLDVEIIPQFKEDVLRKESIIKFVINEGERYLIEDIDLETDIDDLEKNLENI